ncbi:MAG: vanomycin resistance protein VanB, partial [Oscillochloris sp.]|nr:vanomycin resistance protein VanB [Oscillochloris sp.]
MIRWVWLALTALLLLVVGGIGGALYLFDRSYAGKIYPNVAIRGVSVGEMTPDEARQTLESRFSPFLAQPLTLSYGDQTWTPTVSEIGVQLEINSAIDSAYAAGRQHGLFGNLSEVAAVWQNGLELPLHMTINQETMQHYLADRVADIDQPAIDAQLEIEGSLINVQPSTTGQQLLISDTLQEITAAIQDISPQQITLRTREVQPKLSDGAAQAAQQEILRLLASPVTIATDNESFIWSIDDLARLVRIERVSGENGDSFAVNLDIDQIREKISAIADATEIKGKYPRVDWNGGNLTIAREGTSGKRIDEARAFDVITDAIKGVGSQRDVALPFSTVSSPVTQENLNQLGINTLLSIGKSDFSGSAAYRVTNIKAGMALLQGVLVAPGEEFSFNNTVGRIDSSNGFVEGYAIVQNRTQLEWGGGICQDSTTVFRAAFWAGLPITERWGHSFYISWYDKYAFGNYGNGPGMDATIFTGGPDLKFLNDTGHWLLIQTAVNTQNTVAEVRIYGTDTAREVVLDGPTTTNRVPAPTEPVYVPDPKRPVGTRHQSDKARGGMQINFTRIIKQNGKVIDQREFVTKFRPWPNIFEVNPAELGSDGKLRPTTQPTADPSQQPTADPNQQPTADPNQQPTADPNQQ